MPSEAVGSPAVAGDRARRTRSNTQVATVTDATCVFGRALPARPRFARSASLGIAAEGVRSVFFVTFVFFEPFAIRPSARSARQ